MRDCIVCTLGFNKEELLSMVRSFVKSELSPCAQETFNAEMIHRDFREALFKAVINEMVLRSMAEEVAK